MDQPVLMHIMGMAREPEALESTIQYLTENMKFLRQKEIVLIGFADNGPYSLSSLMEQAVLRCGAVPVIWKDDFRWKTLLRLAFSSRASTVIGPPMTILGLTKLAKANSVPLYIRNVVTAGYPCLDWIIDGIVRGLDCATWGCFDPGSSTIVSGFSCGKSRGVHLRDDVYGVDIVDEEGNPVPEGEIGEMILCPKADPSLRHATADYARMDKSPCPCGCASPRLMDMSFGRHRSKDKELAALAEYLHSWSSILDCRLEKGPYGLEMEIITFPGEKIPKLPSCAKQVVRPWDPENDRPMWYGPSKKF